MDRFLLSVFPVITTQIVGGKRPKKQRANALQKMGVIAALFA
jgi:hypothetical protein